MILISLDHQKAYDTVWRHRVLSILIKWHFHGQMLQFITSFLNERFFQIKINDHISKNVILKNGDPQGSHLSIMFFQGAINNLADKISHSVKSIMFANDIHIYLKGKNIKSMTSLLQECINNLSKCCFYSGFIFSPKKPNVYCSKENTQFQIPNYF